MSVRTQTQKNQTLHTDNSYGVKTCERLRAFREEGLIGEQTMFAVIADIDTGRWWRVMRERSYKTATSAVGRKRTVRSAFSEVIERLLYTRYRTLS
jgi:hypothetical protein